MIRSFARGRADGQASRSRMARLRSRGSKITGVGRFEEVKASHGGDVVDLGEQILLPGLINAHCHLDYTLLRGQIPPQKSFTDWIRAINAEKAKLTAKDYVASINEGFAEAQRFGTTTIVNLTAFPELIAEIEEPIRTWWFGELIDVRNPDEAGRIVDRAVEFIKIQERIGAWRRMRRSLLRHNYFPLPRRFPRSITCL